MTIFDNIFNIQHLVLRSLSLDHSINVAGTYKLKENARRQIAISEYF